jgi:hypothetical protein
MKDIKQIAIDCGVIFVTNVKSEEVSARVTEEKLEAFAKALLASEQEPMTHVIGLDNDGKEVVVKLQSPLYLRPSQDKLDAERYRKLVDGKGCHFAETDDVWYDVNLMNEVLDSEVKE